MRDYNFKAKCVDVDDQYHLYEANKIYEIVDGVLTWEDGRKTCNFGYGKFRNLKELNRELSARFELAEDQLGIKVTTKGNKTTATKYINDKYDSHATVSCYYKDEYDYNTGVVEAVKKLLGVGLEASNTHREIKRPAKVGEYVKVISGGTINAYDKGDICKVLKRKSDFGVYCKTKGTHICNMGMNTSYLYDLEYVVLEGYDPNENQIKENMTISDFTDDELITELSKRLNK